MEEGRFWKVKKKKNVFFVGHGRCPRNWFMKADGPTRKNQEITLWLLKLWLWSKILFFLVYKKPCRPLCCSTAKEPLRNSNSSNVEQNQPLYPAAVIDILLFFNTCYITFIPLLGNVFFPIDLYGCGPIQNILLVKGKIDQEPVVPFGLSFPSPYSVWISLSPAVFGDLRIQVKAGCAASYAQLLGDITQACWRQRDRPASYSIDSRNTIQTHKFWKGERLLGLYMSYL